MEFKFKWITEIIKSDNWNDCIKLTVKWDKERIYYWQKAVWKAKSLIPIIWWKEYERMLKLKEYTDKQFLVLNK